MSDMPDLRALLGAIGLLALLALVTIGAVLVRKLTRWYRRRKQ